MRALRGGVSNWFCAYFACECCSLTGGLKGSVRARACVCACVPASAHARAAMHGDAPPMPTMHSCFGGHSFKVGSIGPFGEDTQFLHHARHTAGMFNGMV